MRGQEAEAAGIRASEAMDVAQMELLPGGRFSVGELIRRDEWSESYRGYDGVLQRFVVLRRPRTDVDAGCAHACFVRTAFALTWLQHPGVFAIHTACEDPPYLVLAYNDGQSLAEVLNGIAAGAPDVVTQYPLERLLSDFSHACLVIESAHRRDMLHTNLQSEALLLGNFGDVYVTDWWAAEPPRETTGGARIDLRRAAELPLFAPLLSGEVPVAQAWLDGERRAPELSRGETPTAASDVWGLGRILNQLVDAWLSPAGPQARLSGSTLERDLRLLSSEACAEDPAARVASPRELSERLEALLRGHVVEQRDRLRARAHRVAAELALADALLSPDGASRSRTRAVQELSRALALDPQDHAALRLIGMLFERAEEVFAGPAGGEYARLRAAERARASRLGALSFGLALLVQGALLLAFPGVSGAQLALLLVFGLVGAAWVAMMGFFGWTKPKHFLVNGTLLALITGAFSCLLGPWIYVPGFSLAVSVVLVTNSRPQPRFLAAHVALACGSMLIPSVLMGLGLLPAQYGGDTTAWIKTTFATLSAGPTLMLLAVGNLLFISLPLVLLGRSVERLNAIENSLFAQAWLLRELLPRESVAEGEPGGASSPRAS
ncbi:MAG: hypothetical protein H6718_05725 [Polyangiaceae bacterium]|nr:hypothetical protein [Polyangiaceae bacterium]MCB9607553.1 hypothetical protein [Polyangiaceae bacterium]